MAKKNPFAQVGWFLFVFSIALILTPNPVPAQSDTQPRSIHNACVGSCVADVNFLHSGMGDTTAKNAFHGWFDSYYTLTGCDDPAWETDLFFLLDIVGDVVGAPGAPTMQCWQGLAAQTSLCSKSCSEYFIPDAKYAPNVKLGLDWGTPGSLGVSLDNQANRVKLPELQPNAYSRQFHLLTYLQLGNGTAVPVNDTEMPSLSFPNWITRSGYNDCANAYGAEDNRCTLLEHFTTPSVISASVDFLDGAFYDLSTQVESLSDANGSFSQDGFIRLLSDGDQITIQQGAYSGYAWVKTHNISSETHSSQILPWDAANGSVTITNHECNSWFSTCWVTGDRNETDTYVYAVRGPSDQLIAGTYTVQTSAEIPHEKDFADNTAVYSYDSSEVGSQQDGGQDGDNPPDPGVRIQDLPILDLPGPGIYPNNIPEDVPGVLYRLSVPQDIRFLFLRLTTLDAGQFNLFVRRGSIPVPDYPTINSDYDCWQQSDAGYAGGCPFTTPSADEYYILVYRLQGSSFQLEVEWTTAASTATQIAQETQEAETDGSQDDQNGYSEIEENNTLATANLWDMQQPFTGRLSRSSDRDVVLLNFSQPGIYTYTLSEVGAELRAKMTLFRASSGNTLDTARAPEKGANAVLTVDASAGEAYKLIISALAMSTSAAEQPYRLTLTGFIPDPHESNDDQASATSWDLSQSVIQGYLWDKTTGRADYYLFTAPQTLENAPITFNLTNPSPDARIRLTLIRNNGLFLQNTPYSPPGQAVTLSKVLEANKQYYLKLETLDLKTSFEPYTLSAAYPPAGPPPETAQDSIPVRLHGWVYRPGNLIPSPIRNAAVYVQPVGQPAILLDTTNTLGTYSATIQLIPGQQVQIWVEKTGVTFRPEEHTWRLTVGARSHRSNFTAVGATLRQETPTPSPESGTTTPPLLVQTASVTPGFTEPLPANTSTPPPPQAQNTTVISGHVWRLFPNAPAAGVGAANLILSINGIDQPPAASMIDGAYSIGAPNLQAGDHLTLRAENPEDDFEPMLYQWQAESGVSQWSYDFYSYWGDIPSSGQMDQNLLFGRVTNAQGQGIAGINLLLQVGTSDGLVVIGPTDSSGHFEASVSLPERMLVTVWVEQPGFIPSRLQFFHAYDLENRELNFQQQP